MPEMPEMTDESVANMLEFCERMKPPTACAGCGKELGPSEAAFVAARLGPDVCGIYCYKCGRLVLYEGESQDGRKLERSTASALRDGRTARRLAVLAAVLAVIGVGLAVTAIAMVAL